MRRLIQILLSSLLLVSAMAGADELSRKQRKMLEETQIAYGATIRWGSMDDAIGYLDPVLRKEKPPTEFELNRYAQLRVSSYRERSSASLPDGQVERRVEIGVINQNTQAERTVVVTERWRWDAEAKRWWQAGGLPDLWQGQ
ncbi:hypothetical protein ABE543_14475 [Stenotrophomonas sp. TWI169]|jgi:hypothetical protein|uniref:Secreted protein n=1 Tax=Stenotrophomonas maltophilia TaxID=40324 RepID=A0AAP7L0T7_STEMA|nr:MULTISPECIES: hypothetical protein [Stenotrophomonas]MBA0222679.1 hypothetical protein [Stenotrophomonas maltophilia]MBN4937204.1 hypothetical protein [Stenotrophomonas maltophilia]MDI9247384.1 hypothetical protein [Stenotrophomonas sp. RS-48]OBU61557.1 hypothetical protein A9K56_09660 [Stenotrophomonas maltophilia]HEL3864358.1 hypothetical protein [Stenotrophomonas maltophilia]